MLNTSKLKQHNYGSRTGVLLDWLSVWFTLKDDTNHEMINEILIVSELLLFNAK